MTHDTPFYTRDEAAKVFRCSPRTIDRWRAEGKIAAVLGPGRRVLIAVQEVERSLRPEKQADAVSAQAAAGVAPIARDDGADAQGRDRAAGRRNAR